MVNQPFGEFLRTVRKDKKISLRKLEELTDISFSHLSKIERGEYTPTRESVEVIAKSLELNEDECLLSAGYAPNKIINQDNTYDSLAEINKLAEKYGIEQMGFFDIDEWKNLGPDDVKMIEEHFKMIVRLAKERNEEKEE